MSDEPGLDEDLPTFEPMTPFRAALRPSPTDFAGLAFVGAFAVFVLVGLSWRIPIYVDRRALTFHDVVAAAPSFAGYVKFVFWASLAGAILCVDGMRRYWRLRVEANRTAGHMTYGDLRRVRYPDWISLLVLGPPFVAVLIYWWFA